MNTNTDHVDLTFARAMWNARKTESSLVAWTLTPEWTTPSDAAWHEENRALYRGERALNGREYVKRREHARNGEIVSGEFTAATCACHRPDGGTW